MVELLPSKHEAQSSNSTTTKKKNQKPSRQEVIGPRIPEPREAD
jgi:hypothetical protein